MIEHPQKLMLLVDDTEIMLKTLSFGFGKLGWTVITMCDAQSALAILESMEQPPDVVITDYDMSPGENGIWLLKHVERLHPTAVRVLMAGLGLDDLGLTEDYEDDLVEYFVAKPQVDLEAIDALAGR